MKKAEFDDLAAHLTRESIVIKMESFGDEFERLANTAKQGAFADRFKNAVHEVAKVPLTAAELQPLGEWLSRNGDQFEQLATTPEQKELAVSFREFIAKITSPAVKDTFQRPLVNELVEEIMAAMANGHNNGIPVAWLSVEDKREFLSMIIDWTDYINRGLDLEPDTAAQIDRIIYNAIAGKPCEQWAGPTDSPALRLEDLLNQPSEQPANAPVMEKHRDIER